MLLRRNIVTVSVLGLSLVAALSRAQQCPDGQYWCQDRCATDLDTCCPTPDGQHNVCGPGVICCGFGCCPDSSYTCNADFSCTGPGGEVIPPAPDLHRPTPDLPGTGQVDHFPSSPADSEGGGDVSSAPSSKESPPDSETHVHVPSGPSDVENPSPTLADPEESTYPDSGESIPPDPVGFGPVIIVNDQTETLEPITEPTIITTLDHTFTFDTPQNSQATAPSTIIISSGETVTIPPDWGARESQVPSTSDGDDPDSGADSDTSEEETVTPSSEPSDQLAGESDTNVVGSPSQEPDSGPSSGAPQEPTQEPSEEATEESAQELPQPTPTPSENGEDIPTEGSEIQTEESSATSTMTILPVGAWVETLTGGFTEATVITTTSSGSSDPTIVPIIVPLGLPPLICWGCIPSFPGNIRIKIPEFCVDILGFKIGNCPAGEDNEKSGGNKAGGNPDDPGDNPENPDEPTSTTSCTATVVATYESVFCSVTEAAEARKHRMRREEVTDCSTLAYTTTTACETVAGSTTTTILPQETEQRCTPETCGGGSCPVEKRALELYKRMRPWPKESPAENTWADPSDYGGNTQEFMRGEVATAHDKHHTFVKTTGDFDTTSNWLQFSDRVGTLAVRGLIGCTAVVVISRQGAWVGHFWEKKYQERDVVPYLQTGKGKANWNQYGVASLRDNDALVPHGHMFDDVNEPRVFIMAPRAKVQLPNGEMDGSETAGGNVLMDEEFVEAMTAELRKIFGEGTTVPITTVQYSPIRFAPTRGDWRDDAWESHRGKLLVQYQPAQGTCRPEAKWRVWFEGRPLGEDHQDEWVPSDSQRIAKRQETCPDIGNGGPDAENGDPGDGDGDGSIDAPTGTSTADESAPTFAPSILEPPGLGQGQCRVLQDCMPAIICTGRTVNACEDGKCVCNPPSIGEPNCAAAGDCEEILNCIDGMVGNCQGGQCVCEPSEPPSQSPTDTAGSNPRTCNLHLREYYDHAVTSNTFFVKYRFENGNHDDPPFEGSYSNWRWNEEYLVPTSETNLEHPISVTLSTVLPPGVDETICAPDRIPPGGKIHKRCFNTQWRMYMVKLKYGDLEWDSRPDQDVTSTPHCQVGDWDFNSWEGINRAHPNREMDCRFPC